MLETGIEIKCSNCCWLCGEEGGQQFYDENKKICT